MSLRAKKPEIKPISRLKFMISGKSGSGKTWFSLNFPKPYFIDTEGGARLKEYQEKLIASDGMYWGKEDGSGDFTNVIEEIKSLATENHEYKTLILDSFSKLYINQAALAEEKLGNEFGRDKKEANKHSRQLMFWLEKIDMNVILICHQKDKWERKQNDGKTIEYSGTTYDGYEKIEYDLDLWIEMENLGKDRIFTIKKSRLPIFHQSDVLKADYSKFISIYGEENINRATIPVILANQNQCEHLKKLISVLNRPESEVSSWLEKLGIEKWQEATEEQILKIINILENKIKELQK